MTLLTAYLLTAAFLALLLCAALAWEITAPARQRVAHRRGLH
jgi:hypothetical protein